MKYSISNESVCGSDACEGPNKVDWLNNDFKYDWAPDTGTLHDPPTGNQE